MDDSEERRINAEEYNEMIEVTEFFNQLLGEGPMLADIVRSEARRSGISASRLNRCRARLEIKITRQADKWYWALPPFYSLTNSGSLTQDGIVKCLKCSYLLLAPPQPISVSPSQIQYHQQCTNCQTWFEVRVTVVQEGKKEYKKNIPDRPITYDRDGSPIELKLEDPNAK